MISLGLKLAVPCHGQLRGVRCRLRRDVLPLVEERPKETATAGAALLARLGGGSGPLVTGDDHAAAGDVRAAQE